ncbi:hypothetical protein [Adlercreutzia sp. ZJ242]|uniref:hypothetical protein n=1 Tax=Adlercreutzia sp. ZJ242 TaxID=2709409 RepID=UPI0013EDAB20|nr:hypothetical protein [Adlercreutzia sp. ZJ242]
MDGSVDDPSNKKVYVYASELFWDTFPTYLAIGMPADEFWHGDPRLAASYREAEKIKRENRYLAEWRAGVYVFEALYAAAPAFRDFGGGTPHEYPRDPIFSVLAKRETTERDESKARMEKNKAVFMALAEKINAEMVERQAAAKGEF